MLKNIVAVLAGIFGGGLIVGLIQRIGHKKYGSAEGISLEDTQGLTEFIASLPMEAFLFVVLSHCVGALMAGIIAGKLSINNHFALGMIAAFFIFLATLVTVFSMPGQPDWMVYTDPLATLVCGYIGAKIGSVG